MLTDNDKEGSNIPPKLTPQTQLGLGLGLLLAGLASGPRKYFKAFTPSWFILGFLFVAFLWSIQYVIHTYPDYNIPTFGLQLPLITLEQVQGACRQQGLTIEPIDKYIYFSYSRQGDYDAIDLRRYRINGSLDGNPFVEEMIIGVGQARNEVVAVSAKLRTGKDKIFWDWNRYCALTNVNWKWGGTFYRATSGNRPEGHKWLYTNSTRHQQEAVFNSPYEGWVTFSAYGTIIVPRNSWIRQSRR